MFSPTVSPLKWCSLPHGRVDDMVSSDDENQTEKQLLDSMYTPLKFIQENDKTKSKGRSRTGFGFRRKSLMAHNLEANAFDVMLKSHQQLDCSGKSGCHLCSNYDTTYVSTMIEDTVDNVLGALRHQLLVTPKEAMLTLRGLSKRNEFCVTDEDATDICRKLCEILRNVTDPVIRLLAFQTVFQMCSHPSPAGNVFLSALGHYVNDTMGLRPPLREVKDLGLGWVSEDEDAVEDMLPPNNHHNVVTVVGTHGTPKSEPAPEDPTERSVCQTIVDSHYNNFCKLVDAVGALVEAGADLDVVHKILVESSPNGVMPQTRALEVIGFDNDRFPAPPKKSFDRSMYHPWVFTLDSLSDAIRGDITEADYLQIEEDFKALDLDGDGVIDLSNAASVGAKIGYGNICSLNLFHNLAMRTKTISFLQLLTARFPDIPTYFLHRRINHEPVPDDALNLSQVVAATSITVRHGSLFHNVDTKLRQLQRSKGKFVLTPEVVTLIKRWFDLYDVDRTGEISYHELEMQGGTIGEIVVDVKTFRKMDKNRSGGLSLMELIRTLFPNNTPAQMRPIVDSVIIKSQMDWDLRLLRKKESEEMWYRSMADEHRSLKQERLLKFAQEKGPVHPYWANLIQRMASEEVLQMTLQECLAGIYPTLSSERLEALALLLPRPTHKHCECFCCGSSLNRMHFAAPFLENNFGGEEKQQQQQQQSLSPEVAATMSKLSTVTVNGKVSADRLQYLFPSEKWTTGEDYFMMDILHRVHPTVDVVALQELLSKTVKITNPLIYVADWYKLSKSRGWNEQAVKDLMRMSVATRRSLNASGGYLEHACVGGYWVTMKSSGIGGNLSDSLFDPQWSSKHRRATVALQQCIASKQTSFLELGAEFMLMPDFPALSMAEVCCLEIMCPVLAESYECAENSNVRSKSVLEFSIRSASSATATQYQYALNLDEYVQRPTHRGATVTLLQLLEANGTDTTHIVDPRLQFLYRGKPTAPLMHKVVLPWDVFMPSLRADPNAKMFQAVLVNTSIVAQKDLQLVLKIKSETVRTEARAIVVSKRRRFLAASHAVEENNCFTEIAVTPVRGVAFRVNLYSPISIEELGSWRVTIRSLVPVDFTLVAIH